MRSLKFIKTHSSGNRRLEKEDNTHTRDRQEGRKEEKKKRKGELTSEEPTT